jgi:hypothetical protein
MIKMIPPERGRLADIVIEALQIVTAVAAGIVAGIFIADRLF